MLFILVYGILLLLLKIAPKKMRIALREAAFCVAIAELAVNMAVTGLGVTSRVAYTDKQGYYEDLLQQAKEDNGNDGFYRVEDGGRKKFLLLQWCFPASVSHVFGEVYAFL